MNKRPASNRVPAILIVLVAAAFAGFRGADPLASQANPWLARDLGRGEAVVWYSFHSGWVVRTRNHLLVFDYVGPNSPSNEPSLESGHVIPEEIAGQNVTVFVSHAHGDHSVPDVERWRRRVPKIRYVWGWEGVGTREDTHFGPERRAVTLDGLKILNIHHEIDGIPESAFLVKTDGLSIIFAGDHAHRHGIANPVFKSNLEYLAEKAPDLDLYFTPTFGGEMDAVQILRPRVIFPMHDGGNERQYAIFAARLEKAGFMGEVGVASKPGDRFFYSDGKLVIVWPALRPSGSAIEPLGAGSTPFRVLDTTPGPGYPSFCYAKGRFQAQCGPIRERLGKANSYPSSRRWYASPIDRLA